MTSSDEKVFGDVGRKVAKPGHNFEHNVKQSEAEHVSRSNKGAQPSKEDLEAMRKSEQGAGFDKNGDGMRRHSIVWSCPY